MLRMFPACALALALVLCAPNSFAAKPVEKVVTADTPEKFAAVVEKIHAQMEPGQRYEFLSPQDRKNVNAILERMAGMLATNGSVEAMSEDDRTRLFNDQEKVNGLLARNADDRLVCTFVAPVGSHLPVKKCQTAREIAENRKQFRRQADELGNMGRVGQGPGN